MYKVSILKRCQKLKFFVLIYSFLRCYFALPSNTDYRENLGLAIIYDTVSVKWTWLNDIEASNSFTNNIVSADESHLQLFHSANCDAIIRMWWLGLASLSLRFSRAEIFSSHPVNPYSGREKKVILIAWEECCSIAIALCSYWKLLTFFTSSYILQNSQ